jgi:alpha-L-rhamnosidase
VAVRDRDPATLEPDGSPPVRCTQEVTPVSIVRRDDGSYLLDFGQYLPGQPLTPLTSGTHHAVVPAEGER